MLPHGFAFDDFGGVVMFEGQWIPGFRSFVFDFEMFLKTVSMVKQVTFNFNKSTVSRTHWQLKDALPELKFFNDFPAANPIEVSRELPIFIKYNQTIYMICDFGNG